MGRAVAPPAGVQAPETEPSSSATSTTPNGANGSNGHSPETNGSAAGHDRGPGAAQPPSPATDDPEVPSVEQFTADLLVEVSTRTGYPEDMLDLDLPLESGLGIDSIKVLEIFGGLRRYHGLLGDAGADDEELLARFVELETLRDIVSAYEERRAELVGAGTAGGGATPLN